MVWDMIFIAVWCFFLIDSKPNASDGNLSQLFLHVELRHISQNDETTQEQD
jgi:hypothetical protein